MSSRGIKITLTSCVLFWFFNPENSICRKFQQTREAQGHHHVASDSVKNLDPRTIEAYKKVTLLFYFNEILT